MNPKLTPIETECASSAIAIHNFNLNMSLYVSLIDMMKQYDTYVSNLRLLSWLNIDDRESIRSLTRSIESINFTINTLVEDQLRLGISA